MHQIVILDILISGIIVHGHSDNHQPQFILDRLHDLPECRNCNTGQPREPCILNICFSPPMAPSRTHQSPLFSLFPISKSPSILTGQAGHGYARAMNITQILVSAIGAIVPGNSGDEVGVVTMTINDARTIAQTFAQLPQPQNAISAPDVTIRPRVLISGCFFPTQEGIGIYFYAWFNCQRRLREHLPGSDPRQAWQRLGVILFGDRVFSPGCRATRRPGSTTVL